MDEIRQLQALRPDDEPEAEVAARHRAQLRAAMAQASEARSAPVLPAQPQPAVDLRPADGGIRRGRGRRSLVIAAAAAAVLVVAGGLTLARASDDDAVVDIGTVPPTTSAALTVPTTVLAPADPAGDESRCGEELPAGVQPPDVLGPRRTGPATESTVPVEPGQYAAHWTDGTTTVEVRWPADRELVAGTPQVQDALGQGMVQVATLRSGGAAAKEWVRVISLDDVSPECSVIQFTVYDGGDGRGASMFQQFVDPEGDGPLVASTVDALIPPVVMECQGPADLAGPNKYGSVDGAQVHGSPEAALADFFAGDGTPPAEVDRATLPQGGYTQFLLADGTVGFAWETSPAGSYSVLITVVPVGDGWSIVAIETSGC